MKAKHILPIAVFIIIQAVYDFLAPVQNTNWSIFYYTGLYVSWIIFLFVTPFSRVFIKNLPKFVMIGGLILYVMQQLSKIGMDYEKYYLSVNDFEACIAPIALITTGLTYFILKRWKR